MAGGLTGRPFVLYYLGVLGTVHGLALHRNQLERMRVYLRC